MAINLQELLSNNVLLLLFCVIRFVYLVGNIKIGTIDPAVSNHERMSEPFEDCRPQYGDPLVTIH